MRCDEIMTKNPATLPREATAQQAARLMAEKGRMPAANGRNGNGHGRTLVLDRDKMARFEPARERLAGQLTDGVLPVRRRHVAKREILKVEDLAIHFGGVHALDGVNLTARTAEIAGVIGPNGAGKTTLFRMILGQEAPDDGAVRVGPTVSFAYVDQSRETIDPEKTVYQEITGGLDTLVVGGREMHGRAYVGSFGFKGSDQQKKAGVLSGGERNRLQLAKVLLAGGNVALLDEPTNDLDVDTLRALEEGLLAFPGCAVVISHDRWFLDRIATHVLAFEGESEVRWFEGNFSDYEADRHRRLGAEADEPHRIRYKPLVRR